MTIGIMWFPVLHHWFRLVCFFFNFLFVMSECSLLLLLILLLDSCMGESGMQIQNLDANIEFELGCGESELVIKRKSENGSSSCKILGSREFYRYYRQRARPADERNEAPNLSLFLRVVDFSLNDYWIDHSFIP